VELLNVNGEIRPAIARDAAYALPSASVRVKTGDVVRFRSGGRHKHGLVMQVTENHLLVYSKRNGGMHSVRPEDVMRIL
jgi:hypothetical protein